LGTILSGLRIVQLNENGASECSFVCIVVSMIVVLSVISVNVNYDEVLKTSYGTDFC